MTDFASLVPANPAELRDQDLQLEFSLEMSAFPLHPVHKVPTYHFRMVHCETGEELGGIRLRAGSSAHVELYAGHIGYNVHEPHRGHRYAARSVRLLLPFASRLSVNPVWITCDPENVASRHTLDLVGFEFIEEVSVPEDCVIFQNGHPRKCRYKMDLASSAK